MEPYVYPTPSSMTAAPCPGKSEAVSLIRGFAVESDSVERAKESSEPLQKYGKLAASNSPFERMEEGLKIQMRKDFAVTADSVFTISPDGKTYLEPYALRGVPVEQIDTSSPYWEKGWVSVETVLAAEKVAQEKKNYYRKQADAYGISRADRKNELRKHEKEASDDCSKYAKIREIFGDGNGKFNPNQLVAKKYLPPEGLCEKELLYKLALKISNLKYLHNKKQLAMDPYDFYRWAICKHLKSDLHHALDKPRSSVKTLIRTLGDEKGNRGGQADEVFRTIVLYWAKLSGNENKFGAHRQGTKNKSLKTQMKTLRVNDSNSRVLAGHGSRASAHEFSRLEMRRQKRRDAAAPHSYSGVNAWRTGTSKTTSR